MNLLIDVKYMICGTRESRQVILDCGCSVKVNTWYQRSQSRQGNLPMTTEVETCRRNQALANVCISNSSSVNESALPGVHWPSGMLFSRGGDRSEACRVVFRPYIIYRK
jgi:hypothetical protein